MLPIFLKGMPPQFTLKYGLKKQKFNGTDGTIFFRVLTIDLDTYKNFKSLISEINTEKQQGTSMLTHRFILSVIPAEKVSCVSLIKS